MKYCKRLSTCVPMAAACAMWFFHPCFTIQRSSLDAVCLGTLDPLYVWVSSGKWKTLFPSLIVRCSGNCLITVLLHLRCHMFCGAHSRHANSLQSDLFTNGFLLYMWNKLCPNWIVLSGFLTVFVGDCIRLALTKTTFVFIALYMNKGTVIKVIFPFLLSVHNRCYRPEFIFLTAVNPYFPIFGAKLQTKLVFHLRVNL